MRPVRWYLIGVSAVIVASIALMFMVPGWVRLEVALGLAIGLVLQAPLGWWTLRSVGTPRCLLVWGFGMLTRIGLVALVGLVVLPALGRFTGPTLGAMVGVLVALLLVEGITAMVGFAREDS